jgi:hypothetical protein
MIPTHTNIEVTGKRVFTYHVESGYLGDFHVVVIGVKGFQESQ